jgi:hypothetical protein
MKTLMKDAGHSFAKQYLDKTLDFIKPHEIQKGGKLE